MATVRPNEPLRYLMPFKYLCPRLTANYESAHFSARSYQIPRIATAARASLQPSKHDRGRALKMSDILRCAPRLAIVPSVASAKWIDNGTGFGVTIGMNNAITIGKSGRLVIPKSLRERLGLRAGTRLSVQISGGVLQMEPLPDDVHVVTEDGFPIIRGAPVRKKGRLVEAIKADRETRSERIVSQKRPR